MCVADISAFYQTVSSILCKSNENFKIQKFINIQKLLSAAWAFNLNASDYSFHNFIRAPLVRMPFS